MSMHDDPRSVKLEGSARSARGKPAALGALVAMLCIGLAGCGGGPVAGGSGRGGHPDLVVERPSVTDARPAAGTSFTFSATVRNIGGAGAVGATTTLRVYRSHDAVITPADEAVGDATIVEPAASESAASVTLRAPADAGTYYYGACIAAVDGKSDTTNNCSAAVRVIVLDASTPTQVPSTPTQVPPAPTQGAPGPDLVVQYVTVSEERAVTGQALLVAARVRNVGDKGAAETSARLYVSTDSTITPSDSAVFSVRLSGLAPADDKLVWDHVVAPSSPGTYYYGACVTAVDGESDTTNNCSATSSRVTLRKSSAPDLVITSPSFDPALPAAGGVFKMSAILRNDGGLSDRTVIRFFLSDDATFTPSDTEVHSYRWGPFSSHGTSYPGAILDVPATLGTYYFRMCADAVRGESNTTNNCSAPVKVVVSHNKPNLQIGGWGSPTRSFREPPFTIHAYVENVGGASEATTLRFYRSTDRTFTASDTEIHTVAVGPLTKTQSRIAPTFRGGRVEVSPPATGTYHYGACVDAVANESDTTDNCSKVIHTIW